MTETANENDPPRSRSQISVSCLRTALLKREQGCPVVTFETTVE